MLEGQNEHFTDQLITHSAMCLHVISRERLPCTLSLIQHAAAILKPGNKYALLHLVELNCEGSAEHARVILKFILKKCSSCKCLFYLVTG